MCEPATMIVAASAVAGLMAQQQGADAQESANQRQYQNTLQARAENSNQVNLARNQQAEDASQKVGANNLAMREAQATQVASAGPSGLSVDALLGHIAQKGATYNQSVNANFDRVNRALDNQLVNVNRSAASEINSLRTPQQPDYLGTALKIGGAAYGSYQKNQLQGSDSAAVGEAVRLRELG